MITTIKSQKSEVNSWIKSLKQAYQKKTIVQAPYVSPVHSHSIVPRSKNFDYAQMENALKIWEKIRRRKKTYVTSYKEIGAFLLNNKKFIYVRASLLEHLKRKRTKKKLYAQKCSQFS